MKEFVYDHIIGDNGLPIREWITDEEFEKRTSEIEKISDVLREFAKSSLKQTQDHLAKYR